MANQCHSTAAPERPGRFAYNDPVRNYSKATFGNAQLWHTSPLWSENFDWKRSQRGSSFETTRLVRQLPQTLRSALSLQRERFHSVVYVQHARSRSITRILPTRSNNDEASDCSTRLATPPKLAERSRELSSCRDTMECGSPMGHQQIAFLPSILAKDVCLRSSAIALRLQSCSPTRQRYGHP